jgi:hypothetical protein
MSGYLYFILKFHNNNTLLNKKYMYGRMQELFAKNN